MKAIGLSGFAGSGKTAAALYLEKNYGFKRLHIGETLRDMLAVLFRSNGITWDMIDRYLTGDLKDGVVIPEFGRTSRDMQITIGTPWGRRLVGDDLWVNTWKRRAAASAYDLVMNDSVRFPNEEAVIQDECDGFTILIKRSGKGPAKFKGEWGRILYERFGLMYGVDDSERIDRLDPDIVIDNDGTLEDLYLALDQAMWINNIQKVKNA